MNLIRSCRLEINLEKEDPLGNWPKLLANVDVVNVQQVNDFIIISTEHALIKEFVMHVLVISQYLCYSPNPR